MIKYTWHQDVQVIVNLSKKEMLYKKSFIYEYLFIYTIVYSMFFIVFVFRGERQKKIYIIIITFRKEGRFYK